MRHNRAHRAASSGRGGAAPRWVAGTMSGTSLDGVDAALLLTDGERILEVGPSHYAPYGPEDRQILRSALGRWHDDADLGPAREVVHRTHLAALAPLDRAELVAFHGQTLAHEPAGRGTHQLGSGEALAAALGRPVVWDFRSADVALGGQGAPLAPFFHFACARRIEATAPLAVVNLGGVGNLTWIDPRLPAPDSPGALLAFDTGPANAPIDDLMARRRGQSCDWNGALAGSGRVADGALERFLAHPYFARMPPKSLDRDGFPGLARLVETESDADAAATLTAIAAASVVQGVEHCPIPPERVLVTGGGRRNPVLMKMLAAGLDMPVAAIEAVGLDGDMLEAQAFAYLAMRVVRGLPTSAPGTTGVSSPVGGGQVAEPPIAAGQA